MDALLLISYPTFPWVGVFKNGMGTSASYITWGLGVRDAFLRPFLIPIVLNQAT